MLTAILQLLGVLVFRGVLKVICLSDWSPVGLASRTEAEALLGTMNSTMYNAG